MHQWTVNLDTNHFALS